MKKPLSKSAVSKPKKRKSGRPSLVKKVKKKKIVPCPRQGIKRSLPIKYGDNCIVLLPRDPWWVYSYWDISQKKIDEIISLIPDRQRRNLRWILRLYDVTGINEAESRKQHSFFDVDINFEASNWYININQTERALCVEIGLKNSAGKFFPVARSNVVKMPYCGVSSRIDEEWTLPEGDYFKILGAYELGKSSLEMKARFEEFMKHQVSSPLASWGSAFLVKEESFK
ncbi:MAG: DUF4912 domain-containing protein [Candidatus Omnitrophota bacterium]|nr:MAG: DUF4912 domain-containing protein [Candidatus Omnitrophota bacterium]